MSLRAVISIYQVSVSNCMTAEFKVFPRRVGTVAVAGRESSLHRATSSTILCLCPDGLLSRAVVAVVRYRRVSMSTCSPR